MKNVIQQAIIGWLCCGAAWSLSVSASEPAKPATSTNQAAVQQQSCGYVVMQFDIDEQGRPINIKAIESEPAGRYSEQAIKALAKWRYEPSMQQGKAVIQKGKKVRLEFNAPPC